MAAFVAFLVLFLPSALAGTTVHYFRNPACGIDGLGDYSSSVSASDTDCHVAPRNITKAILVDNIDDGCSIVTYSDYKCSPERARHKLADTGVCFFSGSGGLLRSWKNVCGADRASASASFNSIRATQVHTSMTSAHPAVVFSSLTTLTVATVHTSWNGTSHTTWPLTMTSTETVPVPATRLSGAAGTPVAGQLVAAAIMVGNVLIANM